MNPPYSIRIFLPGGDPEGLRTIEKSNWSGAGIFIPRALIGEARRRPELDRTGVYVLVGPAEESGLPTVYVGEGDPIRPRLELHATKKDFWVHCLAFTSKDNHLNKAHVQYLESRLVEMAKASKRSVLDNGNVPTRPTLSEADTADAEGFLGEMLLCFPVLGLTVFSGPPSAPKAARQLRIKAKGIEAKGAETPEGFLVHAGSGVAQSEAPSCHAYIRELRAALLKNGVLKRAGENYVFTQDYTFNSPSTAAGVVQGRSANGRVDWRTEDGATLKALQERGIED